MKRTISYDVQRQGQKSAVQHQQHSQYLVYPENDGDNSQPSSHHHSRRGSFSHERILTRNVQATTTHSSLNYKKSGGTAQSRMSHIGKRRMSKIGYRGEGRQSNFIIFNTSPTKTRPNEMAPLSEETSGSRLVSNPDSSSHGNSHKRRSHHEKPRATAAKKENRTVIKDGLKKHQFQYKDLKYDLDELFNNVPVFAEPIPSYHQMDDYVPKKLEFPFQKRKDDAGEKKKLSKMELARQNNMALTQNLMTRRLDNWERIKQMVFSRRIQKEVMTKFDEKREFLKFQQLKQPNVPFLVVKKGDQMSELEQLSRDYKKIMNISKSKRNIDLEDNYGIIDFDEKLNQFRKFLEDEQRSLKRYHLHAHKQISQIRTRRRSSAHSDRSGRGETSNDSNHRKSSVPSFFGQDMSYKISNPYLKSGFRGSSKIGEVISPSRSPVSPNIVLDKRKFMKDQSVPAYFNSFVEKKTNCRSNRIATMKRILIDKMQLDFHRDSFLEKKTPEEKKEEADAKEAKVREKILRLREKRQEEWEAKKRKFDSYKLPGKTFEESVHAHNLPEEANLPNGRYKDFVRSNKSVHAHYTRTGPHDIFSDDGELLNDLNHRLSQNYSQLLFNVQVKTSGRKSNLRNMAQDITQKLTQDSYFKSKSSSFKSRQSKPGGFLTANLVSGESQKGPLQDGGTAYDPISVQDQSYRGFGPGEAKPMSTLNKNEFVEGTEFPEIPELAQESKKDSIGSVPNHDEYQILQEPPMKKQQSETPPNEAPNSREDYQPNFEVAPMHRDSVPNRQGNNLMVSFGLDEAETQAFLQPSNHPSNPRSPAFEREPGEKEAVSEEKPGSILHSQCGSDLEPSSQMRVLNDVQNLITEEDNNVSTEDFHQQDFVVAPTMKPEEEKKLEPGSTRLYSDASKTNSQTRNFGSSNDSFAPSRKLIKTQENKFRSKRSSLQQPVLSKGSHDNRDLSSVAESKVQMKNLIDHLRGKKYLSNMSTMDKQGPFSRKASQTRNSSRTAQANRTQQVTRPFLPTQQQPRSRVHQKSQVRFNQTDALNMYLMSGIMKPRKSVPKLMTTKMTNANLSAQAFLKPVDFSDKVSLTQKINIESAASDQFVLENKPNYSSSLQGGTTPETKNQSSFGGLTSGMFRDGKRTAQMVTSPIIEKKRKVLHKERLPGIPGDSLPCFSGPQEVLQDSHPIGSISTQGPIDRKEKKIPIKMISNSTLLEDTQYTAKKKATEQLSAQYLKSSHLENHRPSRLPESCLFARGTSPDEATSRAKQIYSALNLLGLKPSKGSKR